MGYKFHDGLKIMTNINSILITGGTGFFGKYFVRDLLDKNISSRVCIYSRDEHKQAEMRVLFGDDDRLRFFIGDVRDQRRLAMAMNGVDVVVHAAALKRIEVGFYNPIEMVKTNVNGAINVIYASAEARVKKVLFLSTDKAYQPISPYGHSKALAEMLFCQSGNMFGLRGPQFAVIRYGNISGSTGSVIPIWRKQLLNSEPITITDLDCTRFWMDIEMAASLVRNTIYDMRGSDLVIPTLSAYRLGDLAITLGAKQTNIIGLRKYEKMHESLDEHQCSATAPRMSLEELKAALNHVP